VPGQPPRRFNYGATTGPDGEPLPGGVHGASAQPHELAAPYVRALLEAQEAGLLSSRGDGGMRGGGGGGGSGDDGVVVDPVLEAQWRDAVAALRKDLGSGLGQLVPVADLSVDEALLPAVVAHSVLTSECCLPALRNRVLAFAAVPRWVNLGHAAGSGEEQQQQEKQDEKRGEMTVEEKKDEELHESAAAVAAEAVSEGTVASIAVVPAVVPGVTLLEKVRLLLAARSDGAATAELVADLADLGEDLGAEDSASDNADTSGVAAEAAAAAAAAAGNGDGDAAGVGTALMSDDDEEYASGFGRPEGGIMETARRLVGWPFDKT